MNTGYKLQIACSIIVFACSTLACGADLRLWYDTPAENWNEALPIGNGRIGAMVFGGIDEARYQFNDDTLWVGKPHDYAHRGAKQHLSQIRQLLLDGKQGEAEKLAMTSFMSVPLRQPAYQPFGDLIISFPDHTRRDRVPSTA